MVGISSSAPSTAWAKVMGASQNTSTPSRRNSSWGCTITVMSRSPAGPPFLPALPWPRREMVWPWSMPAGMLTLMVLRLRDCAAAAAVGAGLVNDPALAAAACGRGQLVANTPMGVCRRTCTVPVPWQSGQISGVVPGAQPLPWQVSQLLTALHGHGLLAAEGRLRQS